MSHLDSFNFHGMHGDRPDEYECPGCGELEHECACELPDVPVAVMEPLEVVAAALLGVAQ